MKAARRASDDGPAASAASLRARHHVGCRGRAKEPKVIHDQGLGRSQFARSLVEGSAWSPAVDEIPGSSAETQSPRPAPARRRPPRTGRTPRVPSTHRRNSDCRFVARVPPRHRDAPVSYDRVNNQGPDPVDQRQGIRSPSWRCGVLRPAVSLLVEAQAVGLTTVRRRGQQQCHGVYSGLSEPWESLDSGADSAGSSSSPSAKILWSSVPNRRRSRPRLSKANGNLSLASSARRRCSIAFS